MNTESHKEVYAVIPATGPNKRDYWHRIGACFVNTDGSQTIRLNSLPLDGRLIIREPRPLSPNQPATDLA